MAIKDLTLIKKHLFLCAGGTCKKNGVEDSIVALRERVAELGLSEQIHTTKTLCNGRCQDGPIVIVQPDGLWYQKVDAEVARRIVDEHLHNNQPLEDLILYNANTNQLTPKTETTTTV
ncbi:MAG: (2Fe-2S) ferredoxin domain-containing protein [Cytophagia bacterium]|nr:MAG: (2Fe-2S) ferredoxin domain-containing protein [Runella sp.]TAG22679.1 MAG: (2Fe-2S) ferredoxin domain-containing protein [Cytophagales bacterium]TAG41853.1 MAG: (2Fe-2S) ferredoxin domain-containing protein [Cytophagia bacterium]TAG74871.1 MAG: (2Fe-2S) ferredoxin domain-containing protein [Runella slithyformis]TAG83502.1 MAG: (2Fe-2S) ferredoxin domain-containing protein [Cytophagales bacterium]